MQHIFLTGILLVFITVGFNLGFRQADLKREGKTDLSRLYRDLRIAMFLIALFMYLSINPA